MCVACVYRVVYRYVFFNSIINSIQFMSNKPNMSCNNSSDNVHIMCREGGGLKTVPMNMCLQTLTLLSYIQIKKFMNLSCHMNFMCKRCSLDQSATPIFARPK